LNHINVEERFANLGYWVRTSRTQQGIATTVVPVIVKFGFDNLNLHRMEIVVAVGNLPSQCVAEKAGAFREGLLRQRLFVDGQIFDAFMFSFVPADFT
jgi:ribosomal-protein-serine acetyltransferase